MFAALAVDHSLPLNSFIGLGPVATVSMCNPHSLSHNARREENHAESVCGFASLTQLFNTIQPMKTTWRCDCWPTPTLIRSSNCLASATSSPRCVLRSARLDRPNEHAGVLILPQKVDNATNPLLEKLFITFCTDCESCCENVVELLCGRHQGAFNETLMPWLVTCVFLSSTHSAFT